MGSLVNRVFCQKGMPQPLFLLSCSTDFRKCFSFLLHRQPSFIKIPNRQLSIVVIDSILYVTLSTCLKSRTFLKPGFTSAFIALIIRVNHSWPPDPPLIRMVLWCIWVWFGLGLVCVRNYQGLCGYFWWINQIRDAFKTPLLIISFLFNCLNTFLHVC